MILFTLTWVFFAVLVGFFADSRDRIGPLWAVLALVISPLLAFLLVAVLPAKGRRTCPACAELVKAKAVVCKHCGHDFRPTHAVASPGGV